MGRKEQEIDPKIGKRLKELRIKRDMTQKKVADELNILPNHYGKIENGIVSPTIDQIRALKKLHGTTADFIIDGEATVDQKVNAARLDEIRNLAGKIIDQANQL